MLILTVRRDETIMIGNDIEIRYVEALDGRIRLGIIAPASVPVLREKVFREMRRTGLGGTRIGGKAPCQDDADSAGESGKARSTPLGPAGSAAD